MKRFAFFIWLAAIASMAAAQESPGSPKKGDFGFSARLWGSDTNVGVVYYASDRLVLTPFVSFSPLKDHRSEAEDEEAVDFSLGSYAYYETRLAGGMWLGLGGMLSFRMKFDSFVEKYLPTEYLQTNDWDWLMIDAGPSLQARYAIGGKASIFLRYSLLLSYMQIDYLQEDTWPPGHVTADTRTWYFDAYTNTTSLGFMILL